MMGHAVSKFINQVNMTFKTTRKKSKGYSHSIRPLGLLLLFLWPVFAQAKVTLPRVFSDNMVLQQMDLVPLWGKATANTSITVTASWSKMKYKARADEHGDWKVSIKTPAAGGPYTLTFNDGQALTLKNVLVGEVWICSGQSNMEMPLAGWGKIDNYEQEIAAANFPNIRLLQLEHVSSPVPLSDAKVISGGWQTCTPASIAEFSAVAYFFARDIQEKHGIPIGVIHTSWGGTPAEAWTSAASLEKIPALAAAKGKQPATEEAYQEQLRRYHVKLRTWQDSALANDPGVRDKRGFWAAANHDASMWETMPLPSEWEKSVLPGFDGVVWLRKEVNLPANWAGKELKLSLGPIDDQDITWFNGQEIGRTEGPTKERSYTVPRHVVKAGENVIAVRVLDFRRRGGVYGKHDQLTLVAAQDTMPLSGDWHYKVSVDAREGTSMPQPPVDLKNRVTGLYNAMIHPLIPFAIRGAIWYQGESNADRAYQYRELFPLMIADWRKHWGRGDFPFYFVQLANFGEVSKQPAESAWAELREAQHLACSVPNTGMAVAVDIGEAHDIHPKNKQEVGRRLALIARAKVYGEDIAYAGPKYKSSKIEGNKVWLTFDHVQAGLQAAGQQDLKGFAVAGPDRRFYWANATIKGDQVIVWSDQVPEPVAVRYGWADNPICNLYNGAGLPASPFRTDSWPGITAGKD
jgi:sialate O-acetylesterase